MFGNKSTFGTSNSVFGTSSGGSSLFSQNKPVGVSFGQPQQQPNTATSLFGSTPSSGIFGASNTTAGAGSNLFGGGGTSAFGSTTTTTSSLFSQNKPLFGGSTTTSAFSGTTGSGLFGSQQPATGGLFGSTATPSAGLFGAATAAAPNGTTVKFDPLVAADTMMKNSIQTSIQTKHQCITAMKAYETKSVEELRTEDYLANRKGPQAGGTTSLFGQPQANATSSTGSLFGATTPASTTLFAQQNKPLFGATPASTAGTGLFGQQPQQPGSLFASAQKPLFGAAATTSSTGFTFGNTNTSTAGTLFGAPKPQTNLFGAPAQPAAGGLFGATSTATSQPFGTPQSSFTFGNAQPQGGLFSKPAAFGSTASTAPTGAFSFSTPASSGGLFGAKTTATTTPAFGGTFGATQPFGTGTFGTAPASTAGGLFGAQPAKPNLFGNTATSTGLFGATSQPSMFGQPTKTPAFSFGGNTGTFGAGSFNLGATTTNVQPQNITIGTDPAQQAAQQALFHSQLMGLASAPYGDSPLLKLLKPKDKDAPLPTDPLAQRKALQSSALPASNSFVSNIKTNPMSLPKPSPKLLSPFNRTTANLNKSSNSTNIFDELTDDSALLKEGFVPRKSVKQLTIRPKTSRLSMPTPHLPPPNTAPVTVANQSTAVLSDRNAITVSAHNASWAGVNLTEPLQESVASVPPLNLDASRNTPVDISMGGQSVLNGDFTLASDNDMSLGNAAVSPPLNESRAQSSSCGVKLKRRDYYVQPSLEELDDLLDGSGDCWVTTGLTVGRKNYGFVYWPGTINVANLDLDKLVQFSHKEVTVYPNDKDKPPNGEGLNRKAEITLERVWPKDKTTRELIRSPVRLDSMRFRTRLERATVQMGATFVDYCEETGSWSFEVEHFSKYGLVDDAEDEAPPPAAEQLKAAATKATQVVHSQTTQMAPQQIVMENEMPKKVEQGLGGESILLANDLTDDIEFESSDLLPSPEQVQQLLGNVNKTVELMQSSFFETESLLSDMQSFQPSYKRMTLLRDVFEKSQSLLDRSIGPEDQEPKERVASVPSLIKPKHQFRIVPNGLASGRSAHLTDASCFNGSRCRVGWRQGRVATVRREGWDGNESMDLSSSLQQALAPNTQHWSLAVNLVAHPSSLPQNKVIGVERLMQCALQLSSTSRPSNQCPYIIPPPGVQALGAFCSQIETCAEISAEEKCVWRLCRALWSQSHIRDPDYNYRMARRDAISDWLLDETETQMRADIEKIKLSPSACSSSCVLRLLQNGRVSEAAEESLAHGDCRLSLLISQSVDFPESKALCLEQLTQWKMVGAHSHMDRSRLLVYLLLAGQLQWDSGHSVVDSFRALGWKETFGLFLWYKCEQSACLADVLKSYDSVWRQNSSMTSPRPRHGGDQLDMCYQLLRLFADGSYRMEQVLEPGGVTPDPFDYHLSWLLWWVLDALGYKHLSESRADHLHVRCAEQMAQLQLWKYAVFVLMHLKNDQRRAMAVKEMLTRFVCDCDDIVVESLVQQLHIPQRWIFEAKCLKARADGSKIDEAWFALEAGKANLGHKLFLEFVGPTAIVNEDFAQLERFVTKLSGSADQIRAWPIGGQVFEDFLIICNNLHAMSRGQVPTDAIEKLKPHLISLASRLDGMECSTPLQRLCQGEMSNKISQLLGLLLSPKQSQEMAPIAAQLPMPDEYLLDQFDALANKCWS